MISWCVHWPNNSGKLWKQLLAGLVRSEADDCFDSTNSLGTGTTKHVAKMALVHVHRGLLNHGSGAASPLAPSYVRHGGACILLGREGISRCLIPDIVPSSALLQYCSHHTTV